MDLVIHLLFSSPNPKPECCGTREQTMTLDPASWQENVQPCKWVTPRRRAPVSAEHKSFVSSKVFRGHRSSMEDGNAK